MTARRAALAAIGLTLIAGPAEAAPQAAADVVRGFYATLLQTMRQGPASGSASIT